MSKFCVVVTEKHRAKIKRHLVQYRGRVLLGFICAKLVKGYRILIATDVAGVRDEAERFKVMHKRCSRQILKWLITYKCALNNVSDITEPPKNTLIAIQTLNFVAVSKSHKLYSGVLTLSEP